jgi:PKD repeat protein
MQGGIIRRVCAGVLILNIFCSGFFYFSKDLLASETVIFSEIAWMGTEKSANDEWIELYNPGDIDIVLDAWKIIAQDASPMIELAGVITAQSYFLLERTDDETVPERSAEQIYSGSLGNEGEGLSLVDENGAVIDSIDVGPWLAGNNDNKKTMARTSEFTWEDSSQSGGTPGYLNDYSESRVDDEIIEAGSDTEGAYSSPEAEKGSGLPRGSVLINEIVSDPSDDNEEWIEIYSSSPETISLDGWTISDGSGAKSFLSGEIGSGKDYLVLEKPKGNLNNKGDLIELRDSAGVLIDSLTYGDWNDGNTEDNAEMASDPNSLARKEIGVDTRNNKIDFVLTGKPSKGFVNSIETIEVAEAEGSEGEKKTADEKVIISEILIDPAGNDETGEFIELYNAGPDTVDLFEWQLATDNGAKFRFLEHVELASQDFFLLYRPESRLVLSNEGGTLSLYKRDRKTAVYKIKYSKPLGNYGLDCLDESGQLLGEIANVDCEWSLAITPGELNQIKSPNRPPVVSFSFPDELFAKEMISFDASDSFDPDEDPLLYFWRFGDGSESTISSPEYVYLKEGEYEISLRISDGQSQTEKKKTIKIEKARLINGYSQISEIKFSWGEIKIGKILPDPIGADNDGEWIEIKNLGKEKVDLFGLMIDDQAGGSKPFSFKDQYWLAPGQTYLLSREDSGLALNNNGDTVRLLSSDEEVIDEVVFGKGKEGAVYEKNSDGKWTWKSADNSIEQVVLSAKKSGSTSVTIKKSLYYAPVLINKLDESYLGRLVSVEGVVMVLPGIFSSQYFYINDIKGLQVYSSKKDFPDLLIGDKVQVRGEISEVSNELRIKTKSKEDIRVLAHGQELGFRASDCSEMNGKDNGEALILKGEIVRKNGSKIYLADTHGEALVYLKPSTKISLSQFKVGKWIEVKGILSESNEEKRLLPRSQEDINILGDEELAIPQAKVLGTSSHTEAWVLGDRDKNKESFFYIFSMLLAFLTMLIIVIMKKKKKPSLLGPETPRG